MVQRSYCIVRYMYGKNLLGTLEEKLEREEKDCSNAKMSKNNRDSALHNSVTWSFPV